MIKFLDLQGQYASIKAEIDAAITDVLSTANFVGGHHVSTFEEQFASFQDAGHCVGVGNGTDALEIALEALDLPARSEVIVPANSFISSSEAVTRSGLQVVFADVDPNTYLLDLDDVRSRITDSTSAIVVVHLYGRPMDMTALRALSCEFGLRVVEDSAQAHGAEHRGSRVGCLVDIGTFSFYPGKNLGGYGDGGAIVTNDPDLAKRCRMIANHGRVDKYLHEFEGRNSRLDALQAAVLNAKLKHLNQWVDQRNVIADIYRSGLADIEFLTLQTAVPDEDRHAYHLFVVRTEQRSALAEHLAKACIPTGRHYPVALTMQPAYAQHRAYTSDFKVNSHADQLLSLPMGEHLDIAAATEIVVSVRDFFSSLAG